MSNLLLAFLLAAFTGLMILFCSLAISGLYNPLVFAFVTGLIVGDFE